MNNKRWNIEIDPAALFAAIGGVLTSRLEKLAVPSKLNLSCLFDLEVALRCLEHATYVASISPVIHAKYHLRWIFDDISATTQPI